MKHTPGPWVAGRTVGKGFGGSSLPYLVVEAGGMEVIHVCGNGKSTSGADAHLIAAAPDLLEALKAIVDCYGSGGTCEQFVERITEYAFIEESRKAIAKAEGKPDAR